MAERILSAAGSADLEQCLSRLQQRRKLLEEECANEQGSLYLWCKFRDRLARSDPDCPVCHRQLSDRSEQDELLTEMNQRIESMPGEFERKKVELAQLVTQHETLLELRPIYSEVIEKLWFFWPPHAFCGKLNKQFYLVNQSVANPPATTWPPQVTSNPRGQPKA
ncbi:hypothetical protein X801_01367 [Opisthorchis viverrini]|uniref:Zinc-hook domain-containing protein n=1 Tax=Opisthorchis viverrini TaxID=6198 RepID=A0A1S8X7L7_OPIVI|nr:hypothetical protein X801_01367 [Opisthorchis viverrini]